MNIDKDGEWYLETSLPISFLIKNSSNIFDIKIYLHTVRKAREAEGL